MTGTYRPIGDLLRDWRQRRRLSQLDLALEAEISQKHLSFLESGRSLPSRDMVLHLAASLDVPLRERNVLLLAAGFAPVYPERPLADPSLTAAREAVELVLKGHDPFPGLAVDRHWTLVAANDAIPPLLAGVADAGLLEPPVNVLRLTLHPAGLAPRIANLSELRSHALERLGRQIDRTVDPALIDLARELEGYPGPGDAAHADPLAAAAEFAGVVVPLRLRVGDRLLSLLSTTTVFGTPVDITLAELALECFFPADRATAECLHHMAQQRESHRP